MPRKSCLAMLGTCVTRSLHCSRFCMLLFASIVHIPVGYARLNTSDMNASSPSTSKAESTALHWLDREQDVHVLLTVNSSCKWPSCLPRCHPCPGIVVGKCNGLQVDSNGHCNKKVRNSNCFMGKCLCKPGYCAEKVTQTWFKDVYQCKPQTCDTSGPSPPQFEPIGWVRFFDLLTWNATFPEPGSYWNEGMVPYWYMLSVSPLPFALLALGIGSAFAVCIMLCCGCTCCSTDKGGCHSCRSVRPTFREITPDAQDTDSEDDEDDNRVEAFVSRGTPPKPSPICVLVLAVLIIVISVYAILQRHRQAETIAALNEKILGNMLRTSTQLAEQARDLDTSVGSVLVNMDRMVEKCLQNNMLVVVGAYTFAKNVETHLEILIQLVSTYAALAESFPRKISGVQDFVLTHHTQLTWIPTIPLFFLGIVCTFIAFETSVTLYCRKASWALCIDDKLRMSVVIFVIVILSVTTVVVGASAFGTGMSNFCMDPDFNTMRYIDYYANNPTVAETSNYYLTGLTLNPVLDMTLVIRKYLIALGDTFQSVQPYVGIVQTLCNDLAPAPNLTHLALASNTALTQSQVMLDGKTVWPYYQHIVREGVCTSMMEGVAQMMLWQCLVGLILFPICVIFNHRFLRAWSHWEAFDEAGGDEQKEAEAFEAWAYSQ